MILSWKIRQSRTKKNALGLARVGLKAKATSLSFFRQLFQRHHTQSKRWQQLKANDPELFSVSTRDTKLHFVSINLVSREERAISARGLLLSGKSSRRLLGECFCFIWFCFRQGLCFGAGRDGLSDLATIRVVIPGHCALNPPRIHGIESTISAVSSPLEDLFLEIFSLGNHTT